MNTNEYSGLNAYFRGALLYKASEWTPRESSEQWFVTTRPMRLKGVRVLICYRRLCVFIMSCLFGLCLFGCGGNTETNLTDVRRLIPDLLYSFEDFTRKSTGDYSNRLDGKGIYTDLSMLDTDDYGRILVRFVTTYYIDGDPMSYLQYCVIQSIERSMIIGIIPTITSFTVLRNEYFVVADDEMTDEEVEAFVAANGWNGELDPNDPDLIPIKVFHSQDDDMNAMSTIKSIAERAIDDPTQEVSFIVLMIYHDGDNALFGIKTIEVESPDVEHYYFLTLYYSESNIDHYSASQSYMTEILDADEFYPSYFDHLEQSGHFV